VHFDGRVEVVEYLGDEQIAHLVVGEAAIVAKLPIEDRIAGGTTQSFAVSRDKLHVFDAETEQAVRA
jgi:multiple sugar transport system ATP-binding protein